jgi:hypothetical protein
MRNLRIQYVDSYSLDGCSFSIIEPFHEVLKHPHFVCATELFVHGASPIEPDSGIKIIEAMASQKQMRYLFRESATLAMCQ